MAIKLINTLDHMLIGDRENALPKWMRVLTALHFYAHGSYQTPISRVIWHLSSQASVSRIIEEVTNALVSLQNQYIVFPCNREKRISTSNKYMILKYCFYKKKMFFYMLK